MTYDEAMALVDSGRIISRESSWTMRQAGFAWGTWFVRRRRWTTGDTERNVQRFKDGDWDVPPIESSGAYYRSMNTLCESWELVSLDNSALCEATDYIDVTDRFQNGVPKGYAEHHYGVSHG